MNHVTLYGRLTKDPEVKTTQNGAELVRFTVAVDRNYSKQKQQEERAAGRPTADFLQCVAWDKTARLVAEYFTKGKPILLEGRLVTSRYEKNGTVTYTTEIWVERFHFVANSAAQHEAPQFGQQTRQEKGFYPVDDGEIPF